MRSSLLTRTALWLLLAFAGLSVSCQDDYDEDIANLNERVDVLTKKQIAPVEQQVKSLENTTLDLKSADEALTKRVDNLKQQVDNINKALQEMQNSKNAAVEQQAKALEEVRKALEDHIAAYEAVKQELQNRIQVLEESLANYAKAGDLAQLNEDFEAWKKVVSDTYATLEQVALLDGRVAALEQSVANLANDLKTLTESLAQVSGDLAQAIADFKAADTALQQQMAQDKKDLTDAIATAKNEAVKAAGEACEAAFQARFDAAFAAAFGDAFSGAFGPAFDTAFAPAFDAAFKAAFGDAFAKEWNPIKAKIETDFAAYDKALREAVNTAIVEEHGKITTEISEAIAAAVAKLEPRIKALEDALAQLTARVEALEGNIRSLVWMPQNIWQAQRNSILFRGADYFDWGEGRIVINEVMEDAHNTVLQYRIEPKDIAPQITAENIEFLVDELPTRAEVPAFTITEVTGTPDGILTIKLHTDYVFPPVVGDYVFRMAMRINLDPKNPASNRTFVSEYVGVVWSNGVDVGSKLKKATLNANGSYDLGIPEYFNLSVRDLETKLTLFSNFEVLFQDDLTGSYYKVEDVWGDSFTWGLTNLQLLSETITDGSAFTFNDNISRENLPVFQLNKVDDTLAGQKLTVVVDLYVDIRDAYTGEVRRFGFGQFGANIGFVGYDRSMTIPEVSFAASALSAITVNTQISGELTSDIANRIWSNSYSALDSNLELPSAGNWLPGYHYSLKKADGTEVPFSDYTLSIYQNSEAASSFAPDATPAVVPVCLQFNSVSAPQFLEAGVYTLDLLFTYADFTWSRASIQVTITDPQPFTINSTVTAGDRNGNSPENVATIHINCPSNTLKSYSYGAFLKGAVDSLIGEYPTPEEGYEDILQAYGSVVETANPSLEIQEFGGLPAGQEIAFIIKSVSWYGDVKYEMVVYTIPVP